MTATAATAHRRTFEYRPHLDGLRTVAVYLVVVFHAGADRFSGGFIGVDLFFVLSGYLVTHVLISDLWSTGSLSLAHFYARRVRRLLPAAAVTLVATAALFSMVASALEVRAAADSFRAAFLYVANWHFIGASTDYFAADLDANPILHYWSLAIEEQFYVVWPVALIGLTALRRRLAHGDLVVRGIVAVLIAASALWALHLAGSNVNRAYYGTDTRAYQLLAGALLAMSPSLTSGTLGTAGRRAAAIVGGASLAVLVFLGTSSVDVDPVTRGILTTVVAIVALSSLELSPSSTLVRRALSTDVATYLGRISYGTYLWHWPVIIVLDRVLTISSVETAVIAAAVATGLSALSSRLLELPIRRSVPLQRVPRLVAVGGVTGGALIGLLLVPVILDTGGPGQPVTVSAAASRSDVAGGGTNEVDWVSASTDRAPVATCGGRPVEECKVFDAPGDAPRIVLFGDSHAVMMRPAFEEIAERRGYDLYVPAGLGCSWHLGLDRAGRATDLQDLCVSARADWYGRMIPEIAPDLVVVAQRGIDDPDRLIPMQGVGDTPDGLEQEELVEHTARRTIDALREHGHPVVIMESIPTASIEQDPMKCLSTAQRLEECRYVVTEGSTPVEELYASEAGDGLFVVNLDEVVCPYFPICDPVVDGTVVKWDNSHITTAFARAISDEVEAVLDEVGALP